LWKRRNRLEIMANILEITNNGVLKTHILYKANLSSAQLNEYMRLLSARTVSIESFKFFDKNLH